MPSPAVPCSPRTRGRAQGRGLRARAAERGLRIVSPLLGMRRTCVGGSWLSHLFERGEVARCEGCRERGSVPSLRLLSQS